MIKRFFQDLNISGVSYMLISGQASVIYGAATFSEDIDLWVQPVKENWNRFLKVLGSVGAVIYKLTPPISMKWISQGHGFHFQIPDEDKNIPFWFLDVMGVAPRVGDYDDSFKRVKYPMTDWGKIPVVAIRDLVEIKKTRRLEDYPIISNLVRIESRNLSERKLKMNDWKWILKNSFEVEDILDYLQSDETAKTIGAHLSRKCLSLCLQALLQDHRKAVHLKEASQEMALEIEESRRRDRIYWAPIIDELKVLKKNNRLLVPGNKPPRMVA
ncbi:MAG: hypothetical protein HYS07_05030 [Chlamydiae bacterium]|nr:hypothetical protein [Chlamydiota bacterium]MBI3276255.1 hypothetical protein [Chlamydiota bacterium]